MSRKYIVRIRSAGTEDCAYASQSRDVVRLAWEYGRRIPDEQVEVFTSARQLVSRARWDAQKYRYMREAVSN